MITIIGNGENRKDINIDNINGMKIGCNAIYLYNKVDMICAMDKFWREKIVLESNIPLISRKDNTVFQTTLQMYNNGWKDTECPYRGYCSGATALDFACYYMNEDIYLIGFDLDYKGDKVNHIYKDTKFHPNSDRKAQSAQLFTLQILEIIKRYPRHKIYWVTDSNFEIKINKVTLNQYREIAYVEMD